MQESKKLIRGEVSLESFLYYFVLFQSIFLLLTAGFVVSVILLINNNLEIWIILASSLYLLGIFVILKFLLIGWVLIYKIFAPMKIRNKCRFEPTCSSYMIMALQKYGLFKGLAKGFNRISRCHAPNGGVDYP